MTVLDTTTDWHTHTSRTDGADPLEAMVRAAADAGLERLVVTDHVRADTSWVPEYVADVARVREGSPVDLVCGVEAKILDVAGRVDVPGDLRGVDVLVVSDHQVPGCTGPMTPSRAAELVAARRIMPQDVVDSLVLATCAAVGVAAERAEQVVVGHLFSVLPKAGVGLELVRDDHLRRLAGACRRDGAAVEVNEKWRTPTVEISRRLAELGVRLVASSDAHSASAVGAWRHVTAAAGALPVPPVASAAAHRPVGSGTRPAAVSAHVS